MSLSSRAGARVVEANYSCPNVGRGQGALYTDPAQVSAITRALVAALGPEVGGARPAQQGRGCDTLSYVKCPHVAMPR
jgi:hypothetical protein